MLYSFDLLIMARRPNDMMVGIYLFHLDHVITYEEMLTVHYWGYNLQHNTPISRDLNTQFKFYKIEYPSSIPIDNPPIITPQPIQPLVGRCVRDLPPFLSHKHCIVNVRNRDNRCFGYAIIAALENKNNHPERSNQYDNLFSTYGLNVIQYPVDVSDIGTIEDQLKININVFSFYDNEGRARYPLHVSKKIHPKSIDLFYWDEHYAYISSFSSFMADLVKKHSIHWCRACLKHFASEGILNTHKLKCGGVLRIGQAIIKPKKFISDLNTITKVVID